MESLLSYIVSNITGEEPISIERSDSEEIALFTITVPKTHMGTLIGKNGRMINAIRTLARTRGAQDNIRVNIELQEKE